MRPAAQRFLTLLTLALALVLPLRAAAAIVPACEVDLMTVAQQAEHQLDLAEPRCTVVTGVDEETGEAKAAPICDPRGASAVAPPRILPVSDARIDAAPGCNSSEFGPAVQPLPQEPAAPAELSGQAYQAVLALPPPVPPAAPAPQAIPASWVEGGPLPGYTRGVYHPPR
jgi:hypothetical protein